MARSFCTAWLLPLLALALLAPLAACGRPPITFLEDASDVLDAALDASDSDARPLDPCLPGAPPSALCPCQPADLACGDDGLSVFQCDPSRTSRTLVSRCDPARGELCVEGACVDPCAHAARTHSYLGCEFYAVGALNAALGHYFEDTSRDDFPFAVALTNPWPVPLRATFTGGGLTAMVEATVAPHGASVVRLPWVLALAEGGDRAQIASALATSGAVRVRTSLPAGAYQFNPLTYLSSPECEGPACYSYTNDASLLLPVAALRSQYVVVTRETLRLLPHDATAWTSAPGFVTVVATAQGTTDVAVRLTARTRPGDAIPAGEPAQTITQRLNQGDALQLVSHHDRTCRDPEEDTVRGDIYCRPVATEDLTGTVVTSTSPVAVFAGHDCALVPYNRYACDHLEEQMLPVESLGRRYLVARTPTLAGAPDVVRVVATREGTSVRFDPPSVHAPVTLGAGRFLEFEHRESFELNASEPVLVAQFLVGANYDPDRIESLNGDPDMVLVVPVDQYRRDYGFVAAETFRDSRAILVVPAGERLVLDGRIVDSAPVATFSGHDVLHVSVLPGAHRIRAQHEAIRFGLTVTGLAGFTSYTYPGGLDLSPIAPPL